MNKRQNFCDLSNFFQCELFWGRGVRLGRVGQTRMPSGDGPDLLGDRLSWETVRLETVPKLQIPCYVWLAAPVAWFQGPAFPFPLNVACLGGSSYPVALSSPFPQGLGDLP